MFYMKKLIVIADWVDDSMTCQEVRSSIEGFLHDPSAPNISYVSSTPNTIHTGYILNQLVEIEERNGRPLETVFFVNTDPRLHTSLSIEESKGAEFVVIRLQSGIYICGPNAGKSFSFIKDKIQYAYRYPNLDKGSQFRSRDLYSRVAAHLMDTMEDELELEEMHTNLIPEIEGLVVGHIDNYGNIKTNVTLEYMKGKYELHEMVPVTINGVKHMVKYVSNLFGGTPGELVLYPGSSGHKDNPFMEITVWRHFDDSVTTGAHEFKMPRPGMDVTIG